MADPASLSLDDYWKSQKKTGKVSSGRGRGGSGGGGGGGRRGPKSNAAYGGGGSSRGAAGPSGSRGNPNSFRGRKGRQGSNNVQRQRSNRGFGNNNRNFVGRVAASNQSRGSIQRFSGGGGQVQGGQGQNRRQRMRNRNRNPIPNRQVSRRQRNSGGATNQGFSNQQRYFNNPSAIVSLTGRAPRNQAKRLRQKKIVSLGNPRAGLNLRAAAATKRAVLKLTQKRVQRAKLLIGKKKIPAVGGPKNLMTGSVGRVALGKNGFFTVRNTKSKQLERSAVKMKIARAQNARNRVSPQQPRNVNIPGPSGMRNRSVNRSVRATNTSARPHPIDWNTSIVRTMRNDLADEMTTSQLNPEIQRKIAFIQSRSKGDRAPVLQDFKAPVTTSRMKLSDRFRLLRD